jgi:hypothetical protein
MDPVLANLKKRVDGYNDVLKNTEAYRKVWSESLCKTIVEELSRMSKEVGLKSKIEQKGAENLEAVVFNLGLVDSGLNEEVAEDFERPLVKNNGSLVYQQLFNGKVLVLIQPPFIEKYGQPAPPRQLAIYRPEELNGSYFLRHLEALIDEVTRWEDYDDDQQAPDPNQGIGFKLNFDPNAPQSAESERPIGFKPKTKAKSK